MDNSQNAAKSAAFTKEKRYLDLVNKRKNCKECAQWGLKNQSEISDGKFDKEMVIGAWSLWQGSLNAKILVVGQDWGNEDSYIKQKGKPATDSEKTNHNLEKLLGSIGVPVDRPGPKHEKNLDLFFTNAVLCLKQGEVNAKVSQKCYNNCSSLFLKELISIVEPQVIITLGKNAYHSVADIYGLQIEPFSDLVDRIISDQKPISLAENKWLLPAPHCGPLGLAFRNFEKQKQMWKAIHPIVKTIRTT